jgi:hypothetical protein
VCTSQCHLGPSQKCGLGLMSPPQAHTQTQRAPAGLVEEQIYINFCHTGKLLAQNTKHHTLSPTARWGQGGGEALCAGAPCQMVVVGMVDGGAGRRQSNMCRCP